MTTFLQLVEQLASDAEAKAAFAAAPDRFLGDAGFDALSPADVTEALAQAADSFPPALAARIDPDAGLESVAAVDLDSLGLDGVDDFENVWEPSPEADDTRHTGETPETADTAEGKEADAQTEPSGGDAPELETDLTEPPPLETDDPLGDPLGDPFGRPEWEAQTESSLLSDLDDPSALGFDDDLDDDTM